LLHYLEKQAQENNHAATQRYISLTKPVLQINGVKLDLQIDAIQIYNKLEKTR
jgi:hypothetical protein